MSLPVAVGLRAEHLDEPLGIGTATPRLSWRYESAPAGWTQDSVEIEVVRASGAQVHALQGPDQLLVEWPASPLASRERVEVRVRVTGGDWSDALVVEAGLLHEADWQATFITPVGEMSTGEPAPVLHGVVDLPAGRGRSPPVRDGDGPVHPHAQRPPRRRRRAGAGWTAYQERLRYQTYDVTDRIVEGTNRLDLLLGRGWWHGRIGFEGRTEVYGPVVAGLAQLEVTLASGEVVRLVTDESWTATPSGITANTLLDGQATDLGHRGGEAVGVEVVERGATALVAPDGPPVRVTELVTVASIEERADGVTRIDTGQNLVGWLRLQVRGEAGAVVTVRHAEVLEHGELGMRPLRTAKATDTYVLAGDGVETCEPCFTFHGFRYAEVSARRGRDAPRPSRRGRLATCAVQAGSRARTRAPGPAPRERGLGHARQLRRRADRLPAARRTARLDRRHPGLQPDRRRSCSTRPGSSTSWLADLSRRADATTAVVGWIVPDVLAPGTPADGGLGRRRRRRAVGRPSGVRPTSGCCVASSGR